MRCTIRVRTGDMGRLVSVLGGKILDHCLYGRGVSQEARY